MLKKLLGLITLLLNQVKTLKPEATPLLTPAAAPGDYQAGGVMDVAVDVTNTGVRPTAGTDLGKARLVGIRLPAGIEGTTVTFEASGALDGTYAPVQKEDGTAYTLTFTGGAAAYVPVDLVVFAGVRFLKHVFGTAQTGTGTIQYVIREY